MQSIYQNTVEKWGVFEVTIEGPSGGNPFLDVEIRGTFRGKSECVTADGFYDGNGIYRVRFMPSFEGEYHFTVEASFTDEKAEGSFTVLPASEGNHGPVRVADTFYFMYEDGTPYHSVGTTCYVWNLQSMEKQEKTLETLKKNAFNKIRFCVFPKHYDYNFNEPITYPFEGTPCDNSEITKENFLSYQGCAPGNDWDFTRFNPEHFQLIEKRIQDLKELGIEADLIVMHPYDRWGFSEMEPEVDDRYWKYVIARFAAHRNVWWSLANEYDLFPKKDIADWERYAGIICEKDPYNHLRSIHNCRYFYDHHRPWITHCSVQRIDLYHSTEVGNKWRDMYQKPVVFDEIAYEGNIQHGWGNISGEEMTRRFWEAFCRGCYPGHGETYMHPEGVLWWSHGVELHGTSPARIAFLAKIMKETPGVGVEPLPGGPGFWDVVACRSVKTHFQQDNEYMIFYFSFMRPSFREFYFDDETEYEVEVIDTWEMTIENRGIHKGKFTVELPGKAYMAIRMKKVK